MIEVPFYSVEDKRDNTKLLQDLAYAKSGDACVDVRISEDTIIEPNETKLIGTGLYTAVPVGWEIQLRPRSGLSAKTGLIFKNTLGTIDSGYRGEIKIVFHNLGEDPVELEYGSRVAQIKVSKVPMVEFTPVKDLNELCSIGVDRCGGFNSTGLK
jgi:dUTP pyrophosphatase